MRPDFGELRAFYQRQVFEDLAPYWMRQVDPVHGGVLNCLNNRGDRLLHTHKFVWSQGRWAYVTAQLYECSAGLVPASVRDGYLAASRATARFLMRHARLPGGSCAFVLSREGRPILPADDGGEREARAGEAYDLSIFADWFALYGVGNCARVAGDREAYEWAKDLYVSCESRLREGAARQEEPYPWPAGYRSHGDPMIRLESTQELARAADAFGDAAFAERLRRTARETAREIMDRFVQPDGLVLEALSGDYAPVDTLFGRFINPGHTLEDMWFVIHHASRENDPRTARRAAGVARAVCRVGWDAQYGGFPQFLDRSGRPPEGRVEPGLESHPMMVKLRALWDKKLWWTHSEALYALLLSYEVTREEWALEEYGRVHEYAFRTFPNPDRATGEWIQIRDRQGRPEDTVVALPVKDPMHILRAFLHTLGVLGRLESDGR